MGVPKFFRWISERYPCLSELIKEYQIPEFDHLYLDMNGIIHNCSHPNDYDPHFRITEEKIFQDIFHYIEILFRMIQPKRLFFMAVDGVAPRAKQNQQRGRRFRSAKDAEVLEAKAKEKGESLPTAARFDSNCITPGTPFMVRLQEQLKFFVANKMSNDELWQNCKVILSGHETPGEGEHKIMDYIRYMKSQPDYDSNTRHCLYGLDADLIMLGLCTHEPHFSLLREEVRFDRKKQDRISSPEQTTFFLLHLSLMREYLEHEFSPVKEKLPFAYDVESIIDDWVLMGFLVGNDFIPPLPEMHIHTGALPILYQTYMTVLPSLGGYINEHGTLNLQRFQQFMRELGKFDLSQFDDKFADLQYFQAKTGRRPGDKERRSYSKVKNSMDLTPDEKRKLADDMASKIGFSEPTPLESTSNTNGTVNKVLDQDSGILPCEIERPSAAVVSAEKTLDTELAGFMNCMAWAPPSDDSDSGEEETLMMQEFKQHKRDYYINKLQYEQVTPEVLQNQAEGYVRAIQWNLHYYYNGVCSWSWFYPHHYAPFISDICDFADLKLEYDMGQPFLPFQQLAAVLPAASKEHLPAAYQWLMTDPESPIIHYYPADFESDLNGKRQEWEAVVLIPFIDEKVLLSAMESCSDRLLPEEVSRNHHGPMSVFTYSADDLGVLPSPAFFPAITHNHAHEQLVEREDVYVPRDRLVRGLCADTRLDVYFPGFPTLKHIQHKGALMKAKVKVFEQPSRGDNMVLTILPLNQDLQEVAAVILGKTIYVQWPHLVEALVTRLSTPEACYELQSGAVSQRPMSQSETAMWTQSKKAIVENYLNRRGVKVGDVPVLVTARTMTGRKYVFGSRDQAKITLEKQWAEVPSTFALQATVRDISVHDATFTQYRTLEEVFPPGCVVFLLSPAFYGLQGEVLGGANPGRVKVTLIERTEPDLAPAKRVFHDTRITFMTGGNAAAQLGISSHLLSRVTGNIFVQVSANARGTNVGLNLKFSKKNEEIAGYTRRDTNGASWLYSQKTVELVNSFMEAFPELFDYLSVHTNKDEFDEDEMFPDQPGRVNEIVQWMKEQPYSKIEHTACGSTVLEEEVVSAIEAALDVEKQILKRTTAQVWPAMIYKPELHSGNLAPDPGTAFTLFDRVVNVRKGFTVPLGLRGVIIAVYKGEKEEEVLYDVVFDEAFTGGLVLNSSPNRGYRMPRSALINISHNQRREEGVSLPADGFNAVDRSRPQRAAHVFDNTGLAGVPNINKQAPLSWRAKPTATPPQSVPTYTLLSKKQEIVSTPSANYPAMWESLSMQLPTPAPPTRAKPVKSADAETNNLMKLLKIQPGQKPAPPQPSKASSKPRQPEPPKAQKLMTQISIDDMFSAARESKAPRMYCAELLSRFQMLGLGMPRYNYIMHPSNGQCKAMLTLPDGSSFSGDFVSDKEKAANLAAKIALHHLQPAPALPPPPPQQWWPQPPSGQQVYQPPHQRQFFSPPQNMQMKTTSSNANRQPKQNYAPANQQSAFIPPFMVDSMQSHSRASDNQGMNGSAVLGMPSQNLIRVTGPPVTREQSTIAKHEAQVTSPRTSNVVEAKPTTQSKPKRIAANFNFPKKTNKKTSGSP